MWTLTSLCVALLVLLNEPDVTSPLNCDAGASSARFFIHQRDARS